MRDCKSTTGPVEEPNAFGGIVGSKRDTEVAVLDASS
jgi:hypothetical protein